MTAKFRDIFLDLGFDEVINPMIVDEGEVYLQYGEEAPLILDRVFYLAGLDRADIGLSEERLKKIKEIIPGFNRKEQLQQFLRDFKEGKIEADDFIEELVKKLQISEEAAIKLVNEVFSELRELKPLSTKRTLRSHMTALWYRTIKGFQDRKAGPMRFFSIGPRFRREQRQDAGHLYESTSASIVVVDDNFNLDQGKELTQDILRRLGFSECEFRLKDVTSNYYEKGTDTEVYVVHKGSKIEVANLGFYSRESLNNYRIKYRVFNVGFGVERLAAIQEGVDDIRTLVFPQYSGEIIIEDQEIAANIHPARVPSKENEKIARFLAECCIKNKDEIGPAQVLAYEGELNGKKVKIWVYNWDEGKPMISYACMNEIYVYKGSIFGLPPKELVKDSKIPPGFNEIYDEGIKTGLRFIDLICSGFVSNFEERLKQNQMQYEERYKMVKRPSELNIEIPENIYNFITSKKKKILLGGPLFFGIKGEVEQ
jgi:O-phosphoseryl-tRNA synthetase